MNVSDIPSLGTGISNTQNGFRYYIRQLGRAIQSGNLSAAQQAYASLSRLPQFSQNATAPGNKFLNTLVQIGNDVQSGNLQSAQQAFSSLQQQWQENLPMLDTLSFPGSAVNIVA